MARRKKETPGTEKDAPRSLEIAKRGVTTGADFAALMSAIMSDTIEGRMDPAVSNAACNAGGKLLKVVEMQYRYGSKMPGADTRVLSLVPMVPHPVSEPTTPQ